MAQKKLSVSIEARRKIIDNNYPESSVRMECELLDLNRLTYYLPPVREGDEILQLKKMIDKQYMKVPVLAIDKGKNGFIEKQDQR